MKGKRTVGKIIQKAHLENSADLVAMRAGRLPRQSVRSEMVELLVDYGRGHALFDTESH